MKMHGRESFMIFKGLEFAMENLN